MDVEEDDASTSTKCDAGHGTPSHPVLGDEHDQQELQDEEDRQGEQHEGEEQKSLEASDGSMTDQTDQTDSVVTNANILDSTYGHEASDSDTSVATRAGTKRTGRGKEVSAASTCASTSPSRGAWSKTTTCSKTATGRSKGNRKGKAANWNKAAVEPSSPTTKEAIPHLIKLRDDIISAKHEEVLILSRQNQGLRDGIDAVETEMALLHDVIQTKDSKLQKLKRESDRFRREINRLHVQGEEDKGQENAVVVAATQNTRLLKLLEQEELKREDVLSERDQALAEVKELKHRTRTSDERHAERTAGLEVKLLKAMGENMALTKKYSGTGEKIQRLENDLQTARKQSTFDRETARAELNRHRQSHYHVLSQLQGATDELQRMKDEVEGREHDLQVCRQQSAELELRLGTVQSELRTVEWTSAEREVKSDEDARIAAARLSKEVCLSESLQNKVASMSRTILRLVERHKELQTEVVGHGNEEKRLKGQIERLQKRELRLQQQVVRLESRQSLEVTNKRLHGAIDTFNSQMMKPLSRPPAVCEETQSSDGAGAPSGRGQGSAPERGAALCPRRHLLFKFTTLFRLVASQGATNATLAKKSAEELNLSDCGLQDADVDQVVELVQSCPRLACLDLSMNFIGNGGAAGIAGVLRQPSCRLRKIDLRGNQISMEGVRALAKALEQNASRGISDVYVHNEGRIDALGRKGGASAKGSNQTEAEPQAATSFISVAVVDVRNNTPHIINTGTRKTVLPVACRGKRHSGTMGLAVDRSGREAMSNGGARPGRKGNVSSSGVNIARQRDVRDFMAKAAYVDYGGRNHVSVP